MKRLRSWWRNRRTKRPTGDWCATCLVDLFEGDVWEVRDCEEAAEDGFGGTFMAATYCKRHRPVHARRLRR